MDLELEGKAVLVTGGSKGIGLACAEAFLAEGARVAIVSRSASNLSAAEARLGRVHTIAADLTSPEEASDAVAAAEAALGPLDVLVNSAGAARRTAPADLNPQAWRAAMDAKYFTYVNVMDAVVRNMTGRRAGVIVNIIGSGGKSPSATHLPGGAANAALMLVTVGLARAYADTGVRVLGVNPGLTHTSRVTDSMKAEARLLGISEADALQRNVDQVPIGRLADPSEIANVVVFAASPRASYLTGVVITMDGARVPCIV
ncbi:MAG: SDR family NAD(P)-dependent oxidoreductase [Vicinamibacterales bacterium]